MALIEQIQKEIIEAMKAKETLRLSVLRGLKTALKNKEIEKMSALDEKESQQVLTTLIKQRKDSVDQFTKGGRQEMADKESAEIKLIEAYLPKAAGEEEIVAGVRAAIAEISPTPDCPSPATPKTCRRNSCARSGAGASAARRPTCAPERASRPS